ncbi:MAG: ribosomal-processing cysteine protease Prp [Clostridia bacterium]|nr:ribosomal-processing cysteine protease Prp [Clostridia bacterium]
MTSVKFLADAKGIYGFCVSGHSSVDCDDELGKIVCSAVSSAVYLTANTVTEIIGDKADALVEDGLMDFKVINPSSETYKIMDGLKLHLTELSKEYSNNIKIYGGAKYVKD